MPQPEALGPAPAHLEQGHAPVKGPCGTQIADLESALLDNGPLFCLPATCPNPRQGPF